MVQRNDRLSYQMCDGRQVAAHSQARGKSAFCGDIYALNLAFTISIIRSMILVTSTERYMHMRQKADTYVLNRNSIFISHTTFVVVVDIHQFVESRFCLRTPKYKHTSRTYVIMHTYVLQGVLQTAYLSRTRHAAQMEVKSFTRTC